jgi:uncharacterized protein YukE
MSARNGKIARLPRPVRDELNRRLECSEESPELLDWLNALPAVQEVLKEHFEGVPVSKQNLSQWRLGGFQEALARRDLAQDAHDLTELAAEVKGPEISGELADNAAIVLAARLGALVANWNGEAEEQFAAKAKIYNAIGRTLVQLQRQIHQSRHETAALKVHEEQREKAKIQELRQQAVRRCQDTRKMPGMAQFFGGGEAGHRIASFVLAVQRGDRDQDLSFDPTAEAKSHPVKVSQSSLTPSAATAQTDPGPVTA